MFHDNYRRVTWSLSESHMTITKESWLFSESHIENIGESHEKIMVSHMTNPWSRMTLVGESLDLKFEVLYNDFQIVGISVRLKWAYITHGVWSHSDRKYFCSQQGMFDVVHIKGDSYILKRQRKTQVVLMIYVFIMTVGLKQEAIIYQHQGEVK